MAASTQENIKDTSRFRRAFLPTPVEVVALTLISFFFLLAVNTFSVFRVIGGKNYDQATELIRTYMERLLAPTNNQQGSQILTVLFCMFIGIIAYFVVWGITGLIKTYGSDVKGSKRFVMPQGASRTKIFDEFVQRLFLRVLATIMFVYWLYLLLAGILPKISEVFLENITTFSLASVTKVGLSVLALAASIFVAMIFARCIVLRERVFSS